MQKLNSIRPDPEELNTPNRSIAHIEAALKLVSDWLHEEQIYRGVDYALRGKRTLTGVQRVGPVAMDLTLCNERRAHLVVSVARRPTNYLLELLVNMVPKMLKACENQHIAFKTIRAQREAYYERVKAELISEAAEKWEVISDDTESETEDGDIKNLANYDPTTGNKLDETGKVVLINPKFKKLDLDQKVKETLKDNPDEEENFVAEAKALALIKEKGIPQTENKEPLDTEGVECLEPVKNQDDSAENKEMDTTIEEKKPEELPETKDPENEIQTKDDTKPDATAASEPLSIEEKMKRKLLEKQKDRRRSKDTEDEPKAKKEKLDPESKMNEIFEAPAETDTSVPVKAETDNAADDADAESDSEVKQEFKPPKPKKDNSREGKIKRRKIRAENRERVLKEQEAYIDSKNIEIPFYYQTKSEPSNSGFLVHYGIEAPEKMIVRVTLTSQCLRKGQEDTSKVEDMIEQQKALGNLQFDVKKEAQTEYSSVLIIFSFAISCKYHEHLDGQKSIQL